MSTPTLKDVALAVLRKAQREGHVLQKDIRAELTQAGLPPDQWKKVVALTGDLLHLRQGRYYHASGLSPRRLEAEDQQRAIQKAIRKVFRRHKADAASPERRRQDRIDFIQPVRITTEDGRVLNLLSRDLSPTGIRLLGTKSLLGQKLQVSLPQDEGEEPFTFVVRILWTGSVGDDLFENGGSFLEVKKSGNEETRTENRK